MMSSKTFLPLALLAAVTVVVLVSSEVAAGLLAETTTEINNAEVATQTTEAEVDNHAKSGGHGDGKSIYDSRRCRFGCCKFNQPGKECGRCCAYAGETVDVETHGDPHN